MEEGKQYHHELKYAITYADYLAMSKRLAPVMIPWDYNLSFGGMSMGASSLIDASHIDIEAMGQFDMGGDFKGGFSFGPGNKFEREDDEETESSEERPSGSDRPSFGGSFPGMGEGMPSFSGMPFQSSGTNKLKTLATYGICLAVMPAALILLKKYRRC